MPSAHVRPPPAKSASVLIGGVGRLPPQANVDKTPKSPLFSVFLTIVYNYTHIFLESYTRYSKVVDIVASTIWKRTILPESSESSVNKTRVFFKQDIWPQA